jgi:hypothetical protein
MQITVNYIAVIVAAVAGFLVGWAWYAALGKIWMEALGIKKKADCKPSPIPFVIAGVSCLIMAWTLAGLMAHLSDVTVRGGIISAGFVWVGFVLTTIGVTQAFQGKKPVVTAIDTGHWLAVLVVMGAIIGAFGV